MSVLRRAISTRSVPVVAAGGNLVGYLAATHMASDAVTHTFSALLPSLQQRFGLPETALALLVATLAFSASVTQPLFGALADRLGRRQTLALGVILNAATLSLVGIVPSLLLLFTILLVGGLDSAAFHPAGASLARAADGCRPELGVSLFSTGGTLGIGLGPILVLALVSGHGLTATPWIMAPAVVLGLAGFFVAATDEAKGPLHPPARFFDRRLLVGPVGLLSLSGILGGLAFVAFTNAIPLWLVQSHDLAPDDGLIGWTLSAFAFSAAIGGIGASLLSRYINPRWLVPISMLLAIPPLFTVFGQEPGTPQFFLAVVVAGGLLHAGLPLMIISAQDPAPRSAAAASGMLMGFAGGMAGVFYIGIGHLQDQLGLVPATRISFLAPIPAALLALFMLTRYRSKVVAVGQIPIAGLSSLCSPGLGPNIAACPWRVKSLETED